MTERRCRACGHGSKEHGRYGCAADDEAAMGGCECTYFVEPITPPRSQESAGMDMSRTDKRTYEVPMTRTVRVVVQIDADDVTDAMRRAELCAPRVQVRRSIWPTLSCEIGDWCFPELIEEV